MAAYDHCKSSTPYHYGPCSHDIFASARPGAKTQRCYDPKDIVSEKEVEEFADFMHGHGIKQVVGLLTASELATYAKEPFEVLKQKGFSVAVNIDPKSGSEAVVAQAVAKVLHEAVTAGEKILVFCWGGGSRSVRSIAAYLYSHHALSQEEAIKAVCSAPGTNRDVTPAHLSACLPSK